MRAKRHESGNVTKPRHYNHCRISAIILITLCGMLVIPRLAKRAAVRDDTHLRDHLSQSAVPDMQGALLHGERGFFHGFAQGGMRVNGAAEIFRAAAEFHHRDGFRN